MTSPTPERRAAFIASLRAAADFYEQHPNVDTPVYVVVVGQETNLAKTVDLVEWECEDMALLEAE